MEPSELPLDPPSELPEAPEPPELPEPSDPLEPLEPLLELPLELPELLEPLLELPLELPELLDPLLELPLELPELFEPLLELLVLVARGAVLAVGEVGVLGVAGAAGGGVTGGCTSCVGGGSKFVAAQAAPVPIMQVFNRHTSLAVTLAGSKPFATAALDDVSTLPSASTTLPNTAMRRGAVPFAKVAVTSPEGTPMRKPSPLLPDVPVFC